MADYVNLFEVLQMMFFDRLVMGDTKLELELSAALADKKDDYLPRSLPSLRQLMDDHSQKQLGTGAASSGQNIEWSAIEADAFDLHKKKIQYDLQAYRVWQSKISNYAAAVEHQKLEWARQAAENNMKAAEAFMNQTTTMVAPDKLELTIRSYLTLRQEIERKFQLDRGAAVRAPIVLVARGRERATETEREREQREG